MSSIGSPSPFFLAGKKAYEVQRSLRFNDGDSANLTRTSSSTSTTFTYSAWIKRTHFSGYQSIFSMGVQSFSFFTNSNTFYLYDGSTSHQSTAKFRDPSAWYHIVVQINSGVATSYVNGVLVHNAVGSGFTLTTGTNETRIGSQVGTYYFDGYQAEINLVDGSVVAPSSFGETDAITGQWNPKKYTGSYGTNGFYVNFSDNSGTSATTLGKDSSGNGNNFTPNNFSVAAGSGNDSLEDSPTNNWCTLNPLDQKNSTISNGNLTITQASDPCRTRGTFSMRPDTGKWYYEMTVGSGSSYLFGMKSISSKIDDNTENVNYYGANGNKSVNNSSSSYGASYSAGDTVAILYDSDNHTVNFYKNNADQGQITGISATTEYLPHVYLDNYGTAPVVHFNFGQRAFAYTPPTGAKKLCSANLPVPSIKLPNKHFGTLLWTGNGSSRTISDTAAVNFTPDFSFFKARGGTIAALMYDAVRGSTEYLQVNSNNAEGTGSDSQTGFVSGGFSLGADTSTTGVNQNTNTYVAWNWKAGGTASSNSNGTITSSVSANTTAGFSIATYTGNGTADATVGHGLGVAPKAVIVKKRSGTDNWQVYWIGAGTERNGYLNLTNAFNTPAQTDIWGTNVPTSTKFYVGTDTATNASGSTYVAYCFSGVSQYSKFGEYEGNGSADGTFIFTGFRPAWVLIKSTSGSTHWVMKDTARDTYNVANKTLLANSSTSEDTSSSFSIDFLSNGFKCRASGTHVNASGTTYIYLAFAESPFRNARAR